MICISYNIAGVSSPCWILADSFFPHYHQSHTVSGTDAKTPNFWDWNCVNTCIRDIGSSPFMPALSDIWRGNEPWLWGCSASSEQHLSITSPRYLQHANRSHDPWKWSSESSLILTHAMLLIDSLFQPKVSEGCTIFICCVKRHVESLVSGSDFHIRCPQTPLKSLKPICLPGLLSCSVTGTITSHWSGF